MSSFEFLEHRGCRLGFCVEGDGVPVVLVQGTGVGGDGWLPQVEVLKPDYACLRFDNRGFGQSLPLGEALSVELMADDLRCLMDHVGWERAHVVGHSLGGPVALAFALAFPERVKSLGLLCSFSRGKDATRLTAWLLQIGLRLRVGLATQRRRAFVDMVMPSGLSANEKDVWVERLSGVFGYDLARQPSVVNDQLKAMNAFDVTARLAELRGIPSLVVSAAEDRIAAPRLGKALAEGLATPYHEIAGAAHAVTVSHVAEVNAYLLEHFRSVDGIV